MHLLRKIALAGFPALLPLAGLPAAQVDFDYPAHLVVVPLADSRYQVTFTWTPEDPVVAPAVAGDFNGWSTSADPMSAVDDRTYTATIEIEEGRYGYKFTDGGDLWVADPLNPNTAPDGHDGVNSQLALGFFAASPDTPAVMGDGDIEERALLHKPSMATYYDLFAPDDAMIRVRAWRGDVEGAALVLQGGDGGSVRQPMELAGSDETFDFFEAHALLEGGADVYTIEVRDGKATVAMGPFPVRRGPEHQVSAPEWAADAMWYQIMVDRFRNGDASNDPPFTAGSGRVTWERPWTAAYNEVPGVGPLTYEDLFRHDGDGDGFPDIWQRLYGGDFAGVLEKLDYLEELGVTAIYFNPVFEATSHHKYNGKSYIHADDGYGVPGSFADSMAREDELGANTWEWNPSDEMLLELIREAKARGMRVIIDGVFNHLGDDSVSFRDVVEKGRESKYADWYDVVSWEPFDYNGWAGFEALPAFRKNEEHGLASESLREHLFAVTRRWMDPNGDGDPSDGVDGWRLDVPFEIPLSFWREWRDVVKSVNPDAYTVGEIWDPAEEWLNGETFDAVMNYEFSRIVFAYFANDDDKITASEFDRRLGRLRVRYPRAITYGLQNLHDSHDTDRWVSRIVNPDREYDREASKQTSDFDYDDGRPGPEAYRRLRLMALFQFTYVGAPMIWQGTEVGMYGADDPHCRMPMWWPDLMPYDDPDDRIDEDLLEEFRALFRLRGNHEVLRRGDFHSVLADDGRDCFAFLRSNPRGGEAILVVLNNSPERQRLAIPASELEHRDLDGAEILHGRAYVGANNGLLEVGLPPVAGVAIRLPGDTAP